MRLFIIKRLAMDFILISIFHIFVWAEAELLSVPLNVAVTVGEKTQLNCSVTADSTESSFFSWEFTPTQSSNEFALCSQRFGCNRSLTSFQVNQMSNHSLNLISESIELKDAGLYVCNARTKMTSSTLFRNSAQLIVLEKQTCDREIGTRNPRCKVRFRGNWSPVINWTCDGISSSESKTENGTIEITSTVMSHANDYKCTCSVFFTTYSGNITMTADNTPHFKKSCSYYIAVGETRPSEPRNQALPSGTTNVVFVCRVYSGQSAAHWTLRRPGSNSHEAISSSDGLTPLRDGYTIHSDVDYFNLSIRSVHRNNSGIYSCNTRTAVHMSKDAHLVVIDEQPKCGVEETKSNTSGTNYHLWCNVSFSGSWAPVMEWRIDSTDGYLMSTVENNTIPNQMATYTLTIIGETAKKNSRYVCRTFFSKDFGLSVSTVANNIPVYAHTWISPVINSSDDIKMTTLVTSLVGIFVLMFVCLTVYHVFFKRMIASRRQMSEQNQEQLNYENVEPTGIEPETQAVLTEDEIQAAIDATDPQPPVYYSELGVREQSLPHRYDRVPSSQPDPPATSATFNQPQEDVYNETTSTTARETNDYVNYMQF